MGAAGASACSESAIFSTGAWCRSFLGGWGCCVVFKSHYRGVGLEKSWWGSLPCLLSGNASRLSPLQPKTTSLFSAYHALSPLLIPNMDTLPVEILDLIVGHCNFASLYSFRLTCRSLDILATQGLWASIRVEPTQK